MNVLLLNTQYNAQFFTSILHTNVHLLMLYKTEYWNAAEKRKLHRKYFSSTVTQ